MDYPKITADLFDVDRAPISQHLKNDFEIGELDEKVVCAISAHTTQDVNISVGYRVNFQKATTFRVWATVNLKDYKKRI